MEARGLTPLATHADRDPDARAVSHHGGGQARQVAGQGGPDHQGRRRHRRDRNRQGHHGGGSLRRGQGGQDPGGGGDRGREGQHAHRHAAGRGRGRGNGCPFQASSVKGPGQGALTPTLSPEGRGGSRGIRGASRVRELCGCLRRAAGATRGGAPSRYRLLARGSISALGGGGAGRQWPRPHLRLAAGAQARQGARRRRWRAAGHGTARTHRPAGRGSGPEGRRRAAAGQARHRGRSRAGSGAAGTRPGHAGRQDPGAVREGLLRRRPS